MSALQKGLVAAALLSSAIVMLADLAPAAAAAARTTCPGGGTPSPGSTINGGLTVDGVCELANVTIYGGIAVEPTSAAQVLSGLLNVPVINGSSVHGGIVSGAGSAVVTGTDLSGNLTHAHSTIEGRVTLETPTFYGLTDATMRGGVAVRGAFDWPSICGGDPFCFAGDPFCNDEIFGNVTITNNNTEQMIVGDPHEALFPNGDCIGNTIHGSVLLDSSNFVRFDGEPSEIEGNTVTGSVHLDHSTLELNENTIGGSLLCTNATVIHPPAPYDVAGNAVRGRDTCD